MYSFESYLTVEPCFRRGVHKAIEECSRDDDIATKNLISQKLNEFPFLHMHKSNLLNRMNITTIKSYSVPSMSNKSINQSINQKT